MTQTHGQATGAPQDASALDRFFGWIRSIDLRRDTENKWLAGVCSGTANRLGVDPLVLRAVLIVLVLLGGVGITVYLIAWAFLPNESDDIVAERALRHGDVWGIVLLVVIALSLLGGTNFADNGWGFWWFWWVAVPVGLVVWLVTRNKNPGQRGREAAGQAAAWTEQTSTRMAVASQELGEQGAQWGTTSGPAPTTATTTTPEIPVSHTTAPYAPPATEPGYAGTPPYGGPPQYAPPPKPPKPRAPKPPRRRGAGFLGALLVGGLALAAYGIGLWAHDVYNWSGSDEVVGLGFALGVTGIGVLVMGIAGLRASLTGFIAVVLAILAWTASIVPDVNIGGGIGDRVWTPTGSQQHESFRLGIGSANLHLGDYPTAPTVPGEIDARVGIGELRISVPDDLTVEVRSSVSAGDINEAGGFGLDENGRWTDQGPSGRDLSTVEKIGSGPVDAVINANVGLGQIIIGRE